MEKKKKYIAPLTDTAIQDVPLMGWEEWVSPLPEPAPERISFSPIHAGTPLQN